jgi:hypothetical protein
MKISRWVDFKSCYLMTIFLENLFILFCIWSRGWCLNLRRIASMLSWIHYIGLAHRVVLVLKCRKPMGVLCRVTVLTWLYELSISIILRLRRWNQFSTCADSSRYILDMASIATIIQFVFVLYFFGQNRQIFINSLLRTMHLRIYQLLGSFRVIWVLLRHLLHQFQPFR